MQLPAVIALRPSRRLTALSFFLHLLIAAAFVGSSLPLPVIVLALLALLLSFIFTLTAERRKASMRLRLDRDAGIALALSDSVDGEESWRKGIARASGCVDFGWAIWLRWSPSPRQRQSQSVLHRRPTALMLLPDHVAAADWRRLRIWLRHFSYEPR